MKVGIVGAGIMGYLLGLELLNLGYQVTLFERNKKSRNCSVAAAGLLCPITELDKAEFIIYRLGNEAITNVWPMILKNFPDAVFYKKRGTVVLSHPQDHQELSRFIEKINIKFPKMDPPYLTKLELSKIEPELSHFQNACYFREEAQIDVNQLLNILKKSFSINYSLVTSVKPHQIITTNDTYNFDWVFDCRGLEAKEYFPNLRAIRGELIWLYAPNVHLTRPVRFLHPRFHLYIAPRPNHQYIIGSSEIENSDKSKISVKTTLELLTAACYVHKGFLEARITKTVTHCRPTLANHLPKILYTEGFIAANGLYRHGFLIAPSLAQEISKKLQTKPLSYPEIWEQL